MTLNDFLFLALFVVSIWRRSFLAVALCFLYLIHSIADSYLSDPAYYISLILIDSAVAMSISAYNPSKSDMAAAACAGLFLIANSYGLIIWYIGMDPASYDIACTIIYLINITSIFSTGRPHERMRRYKLRVDSRRSVLSCCEGFCLHNK